MSSSTLFDAAPYDPARERRKRILLAVSILAVIVVATVVYLNRYWPEEHRVNLFFQQLEANNYESAYGVWMHDPEWKQHPQDYKRYSFSAFYSDWGPGGEWGLIHSHKIVAAVKPRSGASGVVIGVRINDRKQLCSVRVEFKDKTLAFSPDEMVE
ncbi:MAG: hypothetical protein P4M01_10220 [Acidobacteriota bacterium]|nr:hypothetical protein [Acidobacteriota bacterium]